MANDKDFDEMLNSNKTKFITEESRQTLPTITTTDTNKKVSKRRKAPSPIKIPKQERRRSTSIGSAYLDSQSTGADFQSISLERVGIPTSPAFNHAWYSPPAVQEPARKSPLPSPKIPSPMPSPRISSLAFSKEKSLDKLERSNTPTSTHSTVTRKLSNFNLSNDDPTTPVLQQSPSIRLINDNDSQTKNDQNRSLPPLPPSPSHSDLGLKCWNQDESFLPKQKHAEWLGSLGATNKQALYTYMSQFDFCSLRLDDALRKLTSKLFLRAETQQIDRILEAFSIKFFNDNPLPLYRSPDVVHAISYSILLLNTDLHIADIVTHMSRHQFIKNTLNVVHNQYDSRGFSTPDLVDDTSSITSSKTTNTINKNQPQQSIPQGPPLSYYTRKNKLGRNGSLSSIRSGLSPSYSTSTSPSSSSLTEEKVKKSASSMTISTSYESQQLDAELEPFLRDIYNSIRSQKILLPLDGNKANNLSVNTSRQRLPRNMSSPSISTSSLKRGSIRGLSSLLGTDGRTSPTPSLGSVMEAPTPSIGFASNLSQTIIKEQQEDAISNKSALSDNSDAGLILTDEELALMGPPWAKEGFLQRKHYYESDGKRSKDRNWLEVFVVIGRGDLKMFTFGESAGVQGAQSSGGIGGGNWTNNANLVGEIPLAHSVSDYMRNGYNRSRPHCFQLSLPNGGKYYLQAGTESLLDEWVSTCNYWASRASKEPLSGGVSNMEYGWNSVIGEVESGSSMLKPQREEDVMSVRSNYSINRWKQPFRTNADKMYIEDWNAPHLPVVSSALTEEDQQRALQKFSASLKKDLRVHRQIYDRMLQQYSTKSSNRDKATHNWNKKNKYLITEIKKYDRYIDNLNQAISMRKQKQHEKQLEKALAEPESDEEDEEDDDDDEEEEEED
ncbi:hypothetical protein E3Q01_02370 [Wallemia mellicola]|uniref:SEC7 domain-containing protein n=1 Tax=Wallemia mellicola TaxID=1708541 RepID=A0A4T0TJI3_9BASI|nr:hypothetical protein E3Q01_02370 [Wallemia mellicola]